MFGVYYNLSFWYKFSDQTWWGTLISLGGLLINALLNLLLVPRLGMNGAAIALLAGYTAMCIFSWYKSRAYFRVDWEYGKVAVLLVSALILAWASGLYRPAGFWPPLIWGLFFPVAFAAIVLLVQGQPLKTRFRRADTR
jgi:O-antigen/teichoic acid export membrane protein